MHLYPVIYGCPKGLPSEKSNIASASVSKLSLSPNPSSKFVRSISLIVCTALEDPPVIVSFLRNTPSTFDILSSLVTLFHSLTLAVAPLVPPVIISLNWKLPTASLAAGGAIAMVGGVV